MSRRDDGGRGFELRRGATELFRLLFSARRLEVFANRTGEPVTMGDMVVVSVDRGEDMGRVVGKMPPDEQVPSISGTLERVAGPEDLRRYEENRAFEEKVLAFCAERIATRKLEMRLTACEAQLDRRKIRIYFTADRRADFRGLVRDLASRFHARIEMRQIGVRDDARKKDGVGICGRRLCCSSYLSQFKSVTLKTVREQNLSPNPTKVSGVCSRLMCCLEYEAPLYREAAKTYPDVGTRVRIGKRAAEVVATDFFGETVTVLLEDGEQRCMDVRKYQRKRRPLRDGEGGRRPGRHGPGDGPGSE